MSLNQPLAIVNDSTPLLERLEGRAWRPPRAERVWLIIWVTGVLVATLAPFEFSAAQPALSERLHDAWSLRASGSLLEPLAHAAGFAGLGVLLALVWRRPLERRRLFLSVLVAALACLALEGAKLLLPDRHARLGDAMINWAGLALGLWACTRTARGRQLLALVRAFTRRRLPWISTGIIAASLAAWASVALRPALGSLELNWDPSFRLLIGNEVFPPRPWLGEIGFVRVYGRALPGNEVARLSAAARRPLETGAPSTGLLVGYDFRRGDETTVAPEGTLQNAALDVRVPTAISRHPAAGAIFEEPATIASRGAASRLTAAVEASGSFSVEAWFRPGNLVQDGPARIISLSDGWRKRNFMLGQEADALVFRVRNGVNGLSGSPYALRVNKAVAPGWQHVVATYDHGVSVLYKEGRRIGDAVDLLEPSFYFPLGEEETGWVVIAVMLVATIALPLALLARTWKATLRHTLALGATFASGAAPYFFSCLIVGGAVRPEYFGWLGAVIIPAYALLVCYAADAPALSRRGRDLTATTAEPVPSAAAEY